MFLQRRGPAHPGSGSRSGWRGRFPGGATGREPVCVIRDDVLALAGGGTALPLDGRQVEEFLLTAAQTLFGVAALLTLRFPRWLAFTLLGLFAGQYVLPGQSARYLLCAIYIAAVAALARNRR